MPRTKKRNKNREKRTQSGFYEGSDGQKLFVPSNSMWQLHEASKPTAVLKRANLSRRLWNIWHQEYGENHWLFAWLYRQIPAPQNLRLVYPSDLRQRPKRETRKGEFFVTEEMSRFRKHLRSTGTKRLYKAFEQVDWVDSWLWFGADAPDGIRVATLSEIERCRKAFDYQSLVRDRHRVCSDLLYSRWLSEVFPKVESRSEFFEWMFWLYGGSEPTGWFIVSEKIFKLKWRLSVSGILTASRVSRVTYKTWQADPHKQELFNEALNSVPPPSGLVTWANRHSDTSPRTMNKIRDYALASLLRPSLKDAGMSPGSWQGAKLKARRIGGETLKEALTDYVEKGTNKDDRRSDARGVVGTRLFLPPQSMIRFREAAKKRIVKQRVTQIKNDLPTDCFGQWVIDLTSPKKRGDEPWYRDLLDGAKCEVPALHDDPEKLRDTGTDKTNLASKKKRGGRKRKYEKLYELIVKMQSENSNVTNEEIASSFNRKYGLNINRGDLQRADADIVRQTAYDYGSR